MPDGACDAASSETPIAQQRRTQRGLDEDRFLGRPIRPRKQGPDARGWYGPDPQALIGCAYGACAAQKRHIVRELQRVQRQQYAVPADHPAELGEPACRELLVHELEHTPTRDPEARQAECATVLR